VLVSRTRHVPGNTKIRLSAGQGPRFSSPV
jgi:hypothetical protein